MKRLLIIVAFLLVMPSFAEAQTKMWLRFINSTIQPTTPIPGYLYRRIMNVQPSGINTYVTTMVTGPITGQAFPSADIMYQTNQPTLLISPPLSAGVTIAGTITPNIWCLESVATANAGFRYQVMRWSVATGGIVSSLGISADDGVAECGTVAAVRTAPTLTPTSTVFVTGDRIVIIIYRDDATATTAGTGTMTIDYNAATGVDGDSYFNFTETMTFITEANNGRAIPGS